MTQERTNNVTVEEAALLAGVGVGTIRRAVKEKQLYYRESRGASKLLNPSEVEAWAHERNKARGIVREDK